MYWTLTDWLGSVPDLIDNSGTVKVTLVYDGYGNITSESASNCRGCYAWTGRELDAVTVQVLFDRLKRTTERQRPQVPNPQTYYLLASRAGLRSLPMTKAAYSVRNWVSQNRL